jgi:AcrR family transcriptional regulator
MKRFIFIIDWQTMLSDQIPPSDQDRMERPKVGRPKLGTGLQRKEHLLDCAMQIFMTEGFRNASIAKIAKIAGVSTRTIYEQYQNKGELMIASVERMVERDVSDLLSIEGLFELSPSKALGALGLKMLSRMLEPNMVSFFRMGLSEAIHYPEMADKMKQIGPMRIQSVIADYLNHQIAKGVLPPVNSERAAALFREMLMGEPRTKAVFGVLEKNWVMSTHVQFIVDIFLNGIQHAKDAV